jgi:maltooligosyltrehalose trehalohydrolase
MGEEYGEPAPFLYFVSHGDPDLVAAVRRGRQAEFARFAWKGEVPDPQAEETFLQSKLTHSLADEGRGKVLRRLYRNLISLRGTVPALGCRGGSPPEVSVDQQSQTLFVQQADAGSSIRLLFHLGDAPGRCQSAWTGGRWVKLIDSAEACWDGPGSSLPDAILRGYARDLEIPRRSFAVFVLASQPS